MRSVYNALAGDQLEHQAFWPAFKAFSKLRNGLVHGSERQVTAAQAASAMDTARALQAYVAGRLYPFQALPFAPAPPEDPSPRVG